MTTDTIDALWKSVEQYPCTFGRMSWLDDLSQREEQHAILGRLLDAYLDADLCEEAEAVRRIINAPRARAAGAAAPFVFVHFWLGQDEVWRLQGAAEAFENLGVSHTGGSAREVFEALVEANRTTTS